PGGRLRRRRTAATVRSCSWGAAQVRWRGKTAFMPVNSAFFPEALVARPAPACGGGDAFTSRGDTMRHAQVTRTRSAIILCVVAIVVSWTAAAATPAVAESLFTLVNSCGRFDPKPFPFGGC